MTEDQFNRIIYLLEEILKWTRLQGTETAQNAIITLLKTDAEKLAYENSDGKTSREISAIVGVSYGTIVNYWKKWAKYGIVTEISAKGGGTRYKRAFSLQDFGIDVPKTTEQSISGTVEEG